MPIYLRENFVFGVLAVDVTVAATQIVLNPAHNFPTSSGSFVIVVWDIEAYDNPADDPGTEVMVAEYSGTPNIYNVTRAQENTIATIHSIDDYVAMHVTAGLLSEDLNYLGTKRIDETDIGDTKIIQYLSASGKLVYTSSPTFNFLTLVSLSIGSTIVTGAASISTGTAFELDTALGNFSVNLPALVGSGRILMFSCSGGNVATLDPNGSETINGDLTFPMYEDESLIIVDFGTEWRTF